MSNVKSIGGKKFNGLYYYRTAYVRTKVEATTEAKYIRKAGKLVRTEKVSGGYILYARKK